MYCVFVYLSAGLGSMDEINIIINKIQYLNWYFSHTNVHIAISVAVLKSWFSGLVIQLGLDADDLYLDLDSSNDCIQNQKLEMKT